MLVLILGAAVFVSCVCCWGDMLAIRRVNAQVEQNLRMLENLRSKLMQDNYDYETNSAEMKKNGTTAGVTLSGRRDTGGPTAESDVTRRFAIVNNSDSTVTVKPSESVVTSLYAKVVEKNYTKTTTASAMTTTVTAETASAPPVEFIRETFVFGPRVRSQESGVGMESLFDDINHLLNHTEKHRTKPNMRAEPETSLNHEPITLNPLEDGDGKLTLKNIEDLEFKFLRVKEGIGYRRKEGEESVIVTSKDGLFSQIKLPESRRQYMASESEADDI